jgi:hypothetical protein
LINYFVVVVVVSVKVEKPMDVMRQWVTMEVTRAEATINEMGGKHRTE